MSNFPQYVGGGKTIPLGVDTAGTAATSLAAPASANTKGAWTELEASTGADIDGFCFHFGSTPAPSVQLIDVAVGAAASEQVILSNVMCHRGTVYLITPRYIPLHIPKGSRVSARYQSNTIAGDSVLCTGYGIVQGIAGNKGMQSAQTFGADTTDSSGTQIDPGGVADTKGSWVELTAATSERIKAISIAFSIGSNADTVYLEWLFDIGVGAASSEVVVVPDLLVNSNGTEECRPDFMGPFSVDIPPGSRIAVRSQCSGTDATDRLLDAIVYGYG